MVKMHIPGINIEVHDGDVAFYERAGYVKDEQVPEVVAPVLPDIEPVVEKLAEESIVVAPVKAPAKKSKKSKVV